MEPYEEHILDAVPRIGEHVIVATEGPWLEVQAVVHIPRNLKIDCDAEVYAVEVDHLEVLSRIARAQATSADATP